MPKTLGPGDWREVGDGAYLLSLSAEELATAGAFLVRIAGVDTLSPPILPQLIEIKVIDAPSAAPDPQRTRLTGHVVGIDGSPIANATIGTSILKPPVAIDGVVLEHASITLVTDVNGYFELSLVSGAQVEVIIAKTGWKKTFIVPSAPRGTSVRLFDIA